MFNNINNHNINHVDDKDDDQQQQQQQQQQSPQQEIRDDEHQAYILDGIDDFIYNYNTNRVVPFVPQGGRNIINSDSFDSIGALMERQRARERVLESAIGPRIDDTTHIHLIFEDEMERPIEADEENHDLNQFERAILDDIVGVQPGTNIQEEQEEEDDDYYNQQIEYEIQEQRVIYRNPSRFRYDRETGRNLVIEDDGDEHVDGNYNFNNNSNSNSINNNNSELIELFRRNQFFINNGYRYHHHDSDQDQEDIDVDVEGYDNNEDEMYDQEEEEDQMYGQEDEEDEEENDDYLYDQEEEEEEGEEDQDQEIQLEENDDYLYDQEEEEEEDQDHQRDIFNENIVDYINEIYDQQEIGPIPPSEIEIIVYHPITEKYGYAGWSIYNKLFKAKLFRVETGPKFLAQLLGYYIMMANNDYDSFSADNCTRLTHFINSLIGLREAKKLIECKRLSTKNLIPLKLTLDILEHYYRNNDSPTFKYYTNSVLPIMQLFYTEISNEKLTYINDHLVMALEPVKGYNKVIKILYNRHLHLSYFKEQLWSIRNLSDLNDYSHYYQ
ncbi:hypothetical protein CYY_006428 [Polysphondylium violaceum]|uniref:Uncharacterized protein n=1 Tax=Polysphondylium violaceum TaxID=133409 RepID=A0A8J4PQX5_9MYCE|nr:hypothetical protein CYY_006428 [Polysphondylium violaceum]